MDKHKLEKPLFKIDFTKWRLPKNPETGLPIEPVPEKDFDKFEYWSDELNRPVRQVIPKKGSPLYADRLSLKTATLYRGVCSLGISAYDDEITKEVYEELCQTELLKYHYHKQINYEVLLPFQRLALDFLKLAEQPYILKTSNLYTVNVQKRILEMVTSNTKDIINQAEKVSEFEFYYLTIKELIKKHGAGFLDN